jgi:hypothetical protein
MMKTTTRSFTTVVTFLLAALLHVGIPLGFSEPRILPAAIVEGLCGLLLAVSTCALVARTTWAWGGALAAHLVAVAGVLLGIIALALGAGPSTSANTIYHRVILGVLIVVLVGLSTPAAQAALGHRTWA